MRRVAAVVGLGVICAVVPAAAQVTEKVAVGAIEAPPQLAREAAAVRALLRSAVFDERGEARARIELARRLDAAADAAARRSLAGAAGVDVLLEARLSLDGSMLTVELRALDPGGDGSGEAGSASARWGDLDALAAALYEASKAHSGALYVEPPKGLSLVALAPLAAAHQALGAGDADGAAGELAALDMKVALALPAVRALAAAVAADPAASAEHRLLAALAVWDREAAQRVVEAAPRAERAALSAILDARVALVRSDLVAARRAVDAQARSPSPGLAWTRAMVYRALDDPRGTTRALLPLVSAAEPYVPALAWAATLGGKPLPDEIEDALLAAAVRIAGERPTLAAALAARALRLGGDAARALPLVDVFALDDAGIAAVTPAVERGVSVANPVALRLSADLHLRRGEDETARAIVRRALTLSPGDPVLVHRKEILLDAPAAAPVVAPAALDQKAPATARPARLAGELVDELAALVAALPPSPSLRPGARVGLVRRAGSGEGWYWPRQLDQSAFEEGLALALSAPPARLLTSVGDAPLEALSRAELDAAAQRLGAPLVVAYEVHSDGGAAAVKLVVYDSATGEASEVAGTLSGDVGLVSWNRLYTVGGASVLFLLLAYLVYAALRGWGTVVVALELDPLAERDHISVVLSRSNASPRQRAGRGLRRSRRRADLAGATTRFERVPAGRWFVHVLGSYERGQETITLPDTVVERTLRRGVVEEVAIDLVPETTAIRFAITSEDGPVARATVRVAGHGEVVTDRDGHATMSLPRGTYDLMVTAGKVELRLSLDVPDTRPRTRSINVTREQRLAALADGVELEEVAQPMVVERISGPDDAAARVARDKTLATGSAVRPALKAETGGGAGGDAVLAGLRRYRPVTELGNGAMGVVYTAVDEVLDRKVALKLMSEDVRRHPAARDMFVQEARALAALNHPNIVTVYDQGSDGGQMFIVMELVEGTTLETLLQERKRLPLAQVLQIGCQMARALAYAHERRILHRDIKPANIFVTGDGTAKLGDFGIARVVQDALIKKTEIKGTPLYMAPEQILGANIDFRADLYALGCTLFEAACGQPPFVDGEILYHHVNSEAPALSTLLPGVPAPLEDILGRCLAKDKDARFSSAAELEAALAAVQAA